MTTLDSPTSDYPTKRPPLMTEHEVLVQTRDLIARYGWCQHANWNPLTGEHCLEGAIARVGCGKELAPGWLFSTTGTPVRAVSLLMEMTDQKLDLATWNDMKGRTEEEVLALLDAAIEITATQRTEEKPSRSDLEITAGLTQPSRTIIVEPLEEPAIQPERTEPTEPVEPAPEKEPEKVPAGA